MRPQRIGLITLLTVLATLAIDNVQFIRNPISKSQNLQVLAQTPDARKAEADRLLQQGNQQYQTDQFEAAKQSFQQALTIYREIKDRQGEGRALALLGAVYGILNDFAHAIETLRQSLAIAKEINDRQLEAAAQKFLLLVQKSQNNSPSPRKAEADRLNEQGIQQGQTSQFEAAKQSFQQALIIYREINDREGEAKSLSNLGLAYYYLGDGEGLALNNLGLALFKSGNLTQAEKILRTGIEVWESLRGRLGNNDAYKVSIFEQQARTYRLLQQVLTQENNPNAALEIAERGRARAFVELLARRNATTSDFANSPITPPTIEQLQQIAKQQNATLVEYSIIYDDFKIKGKQETHESELCIWVIKPTGEVTFRRSDLKPLWQKQNTTLADLVYISRDSIGVRDLPIIGFRPRPGAIQKQEASLTEQLQQLHQLLIEPIADLLPTDPNAHVVFLPQDSLFLVPFPALKDKDGKYLIEKHTILTAPSIQVLQLTREQRQRVGARHAVPLQGNDAIVVGNPTMPSVPPEPGQPAQPLPSLPGSEMEANAIAPLLNTKPLIGNVATKSAVVQLLPKARIIHLATHGLLDDVRGLGSAIALAPDPLSSVPPLTKGGIGGVNGLLTAEEILDMKLNADLVVLSACNTGRGRITGDGVIGLSRSLISAGVPSVIVSLWSVPDAPTAELMTEFYQNLQKNPDKAQALRQAMLTTMKQHPNPKDWAAFTLIGEAE
jgi:CHAT domain-containing protein/Flp pilus assembly protein TadD